MSAKNRVSGGEMDLIGKVANIIQGGIRSENEWTGVRVADVSEKAVSVEWESRGVRFFDVIPWHSITQISVRFSNTGETATEPKTA